MRRDVCFTTEFIDSESNIFTSLEKLTLLGAERVAGGERSHHREVSDDGYGGDGEHDPVRTG